MDAVCNDRALRLPAHCKEERNIQIKTTAGLQLTNGHKNCFQLVFFCFSIKSLVLDVSDMIVCENVAT